MNVFIFWFVFDEITVATNWIFTRILNILELEWSEGTVSSIIFIKNHFSIKL